MSAVEVGQEAVELSVVIPCLNEAETIGICLDKINRVFAEHGIRGEAVVGDNGSTDGSIEIAREKGARVINVTQKGYGNALRGGIAAARAPYIIMGDADDSYDFLEIPKFLKQLRAGHQFVYGCRLPTGGGTVMPGAMPWSHRHIGNPLFSLLARLWFHAPIHDVYCGMRGFRKDAYEELNQQCTGMEFATEMVIKSSLFRRDIVEVPITLHPDGRKSRKPHLRTMRDGWRTLRFFLLYSPRWLFLLPGLVLGLVGFVIALLGGFKASIGNAVLGVHSLTAGLLMAYIGLQTVFFGVIAKTFATNESLSPADALLKRLQKFVTLEKGILLSVAAILGGVALFAIVLALWWQSGFGPLDYAQTLRLVVPGTFLIATGWQTLFFAFTVSLLSIRRR
ncbi:MAG: glycosyltransferase family 2 protein [Verrucomicrobiota bacterium JB022]|nr:glycosyltransferase family 2 protein [Verrucomicrobiota bacterium JB022]